jgi:competence protein ComEC
VVFAFVAVLCLALFGVTHNVRIVVLFGICVLGLAAGAYRYRSAEQMYVQSKNEVTRVAQTAKQYVGVVVSDRDEREKDMQADVRLAEFVSTPVVRVSAQRHSPLAYADRVVIEGKILFPKNFAQQPDDVGAPFDYSAYLRAQGIVGDVKFAKVAIVTHPEKDIAKSDREIWTEKIFTSLYSVKHAFRDSIRRTLDEPYASLELGLLVGEKHGLSKVEIQNFTTAGLSHIVVLSGFNITVIVALVFRLFSFLPRRWNFLLGSLLAVMFVAMTGFSSTAVRALLMAGIVVAGQALYRSSVPLVSLLVVCTLMVAWNPFILRDDVSFQLSAFATLGIILYGNTCSDWFAARVGRGAGEFLGVTCAASIFTLPLIAYTFGTVSIISPVANLLVLPLVQPAMALGALAGFIGMTSFDISPVLVPFHYIAYAFGLATQSVLALAFLFVDTLASIPYASVSVTFPLWAMVGCWVTASVYAYVKEKDTYPQSVRA